MRVLVVKTSSMGDIIHTLPALTDAARAIPDIQFDWLIEENFAEIPAWHSHVKRVIPVALRRWRKNLLAAATRKEWQAMRTALNAEQYDLIIDAQGLIKSAVLACFAKGTHCGFDFQSARETCAAFFYQRKFSITQNQHAIPRLRKLFSQVLNYPLPDSVAEYGIDRQRFITDPAAKPYLVFLHGTTWPTKHWPEEYWLQLAKIAQEKNFVVKLPWGTAEEEARAKRIAAACQSVEVLPRLDLLGMARVLAGAKAVVAVDTGLGHLTAALDVPAVSLYGPTDPELTGALGRTQIHLTAPFPCAPCFNRQCHYPFETSPFKAGGVDVEGGAAASSLYTVKPPCFGTLPPGAVWGALEGLLAG